MGSCWLAAATLHEPMATLLSAKFDQMIREGRDALLLRLAPLVEIVEIVQTIRASRDPNDDRFLESGGERTGPTCS